MALNLDGGEDWRTVVPGYADRSAYDSIGPYREDRYTATTSNSRIWFAGMAGRTFNPGLGDVSTGDGFILGFDRNGKLVQQQARSHPLDAIIKQVSGRGERLGVLTETSGIGAYQMKFDVNSEAGRQIWSRSARDDANITGGPNFYRMVVFEDGSLVATGGLVGGAKWDGFELTTAGFWPTPVAAKFSPSGSVVWVAKPVFISGDLGGGASEPVLREDGTVLFLSYLGGVGRFRYGHDEFVVDHPCCEGGGDIFLSALSANGQFLWTHRLDARRILRVHELQGELFLLGYDYETVDAATGGLCMRWWLKRLDSNGELLPFFSPLATSCEEQPAWRAELRIADLGNGKLAVGGTFLGEVRVGDRVFSNEGRTDEDIYVGVIDLPTQ